MFNIINSLIKLIYAGLLNFRIRAKFFLFILAYFLINPFLKSSLKKRQIWVIGENTGECLRDNAYCFFKYCNENNLKEHVFFLASKKSLEDDVYLASSGNVICCSSMRHYFYLLFADVYIYSHTHIDIGPDILFPFISKRKKMVWLQHGVTGFKKFDYGYQKYCNEPDILVVVSDFEKAIIANQVGTKKNKIRITGFARHDYLINTAPFKDQKQIAYMPTWREWIKKEEFLNSKFYKQISSLILNQSLTEFLEKNNITLKFYLHKNMKDYISFFHSVSDRIQLIRFGQESVQQMIKESSLLITDYSSISWDFYYLDKPVLFYQFDLEDYLNNRGSYLDLRKNIFSDIVDSENDLLDVINCYIENNFQISEKNNSLKSNFFKYFDKSNCERIYKEIIKL